MNPRSRLICKRRNSPLRERPCRIEKLRCWARLGHPSEEALLTFRNAAASLMPANSAHRELRFFAKRKGICFYVSFSRVYLVFFACPAQEENHNFCRTGCTGLVTGLLDWVHGTILSCARQRILHHGFARCDGRAIQKLNAESAVSLEDGWRISSIPRTACHRTHRQRVNAAARFRQQRDQTSSTCSQAASS